jgi:hypothetical protein
MESSRYLARTCGVVIRQSEAQAIDDFRMCGVEQMARAISARMRNTSGEQHETWIF